MDVKLFFRIVLASLLGEITLILGTTIAQVVIVDGVFWDSSSVPDLIIGGSATLIAGIIAGIVASLIIKRNNYWPHIVISILIASETIYLILSGNLSDPLWFDLLSGIALIIMIWVGYGIYHRLKTDTEIISD